MGIDLSIELAGLKLKNPVLTASGTCGFGEAYEDFFPPAKLGALVIKGVTLKPREGNPSPRLAETPGGLLNSIGLENPGVERVLKDYLPPLANIKTPVIANIAGNTVEEYTLVAEKISQSPVIKALEVNISCPNVKSGGLEFGSTPELAAKVIKAVKKSTDRPVWAKLSPNVTDIVSMALAVEEAGADAISLINTLLGMAVDVKTKRPVLANVVGGLSGPAIKPVAIRMVWQVSQRVHIPVIGVGGITKWQDAVEFILAGATAVAIGTGQFLNPLCCLEVIEGLEQYCQEQGVARIKDLTGAAWKEEIHG